MGTVHQFPPQAGRFEALDMAKLDDGAAALAAKSQATSPYLNQPLRTEAEVRAVATLTRGEK